MKNLEEAQQLARSMVAIGQEQAAGWLLYSVI